MLQRIFQRVQIVKLNHPRCLGRVHRRPNISAPWSNHSITHRRKRFVHCPVIAIVVNQHFRALCNLPRDSNCKPVRIRRRQRKLPVRQSKSPLQFFADPQRIFRRQHQRDTFADTLRNRFRRNIRGMSRHCTRITQAQIDVLTPVHIRKMRALRLHHKNRKCPRPLLHPIHRHAAKQRILSPRVKLRRPRMLRYESLRFSGL